MEHEIIAVLVRCDRSTYTSVGIDIRPDSCLTDAARLLGMLRAGTTLYLQERTTGRGWRCIATGQPCAWVIAEQRAFDVAEHRARVAERVAALGTAT